MTRLADRFRWPVAPFAPEAGGDVMRNPRSRRGFGPRRFSAMVPPVWISERLQGPMRSTGCRRVGGSSSCLLFLAGCGPQYEAPTAHPNPILIREFAVSPGIVTLDPSFGFSLYRGERGVPREQRAAGLGRAVAFNLTDAMAEYLTGLGYDVLRSETGSVEPGMRALIVSGTFRRIDEGQTAARSAPRTAASRSMSRSTIRFTDRRRSGLPRFQLNSRQVGGGLVGVSARTRGDVKIAAQQLGAELGRYVAEVARSQRWPAAGR